jgi:hypothetical protein
MFLKHGARDPEEYVQRLKTTCREQGEKSRAAKVARLIRPLFNTMNMYAPIARTMIQADPTSSALVLGGITCIMSISSRFLDHQEKIVDVLAEMSPKLPPPMLPRLFRTFKRSWAALLPQMSLKSFPTLKAWLVNLGRREPWKSLAQIRLRGSKMREPKGCVWKAAGH